MTLDYTLQSDYTVELDTDEEKFILVSGVLSTLLVSIDGTTGYDLAFQLSNDSTEYFESKSLTSEIQWEYIPISGSPVSSITTKQDSIPLSARNIIWIKNTGTEICKVSLRGNRA